MAAVAPVVTVTPQQPAISNMQVLPVTIAVTGSGATPTGSVVLSSGAYNSPASVLVNGQTVIQIPAGVLASGAFRNDSARVLGYWPLERAFVESVLGGQ